MNDQYTSMIDIYRKIEKSMSVPVNINHEQITEIVVSQLLVLYKASIKRNEKEFGQAVERVLLHYLEPEELNHLLQEAM